ncbi:hypothetical protein LRS06_15470 [Hymenobacter sp. J193]|uniref:hypothetical protein n=1 Tax=Hymenobacter sp. J193 TaxID=2898429 RepID=UPI0021514B45|nr:hypothetical protein [Hymenobacter sp. J193]MCR5889136.1 hypothetical protein [Hymenobacter sp. J193]
MKTAQSIVKKHKKILEDVHNRLCKEVQITIPTPLLHKLREAAASSVLDIDQNIQAFRQYKGIEVSSKCQGLSLIFIE